MKSKIVNITNYENEFTVGEASISILPALREAPVLGAPTALYKESDRVAIRELYEDLKVLVEAGLL